MSITIFSICLLLLLSPLDITMAGRVIPPSAPSTITRPLVSEQAETYVTIKPQLEHKQNVFQGREVKDCLPKGLRHSSAPSRFVNYHELGSGGCSSEMHSKKP
ncbi:Maintenance of mitochondrial morphology protein like [Quillaja saponaria]|uniref:Maintenance of mitochondrial morphology protein like n=1 Tax=Quillaja saponaria TaxID=32244 RepID=A0AAD7KY93_QUISA|nr:Maintenance of mitochondrial morphology protein like [Quillaja saponaria]